MVIGQMQIFKKRKSKSIQIPTINDFPLPALSTLWRWASTFSVEPGILRDMLMLMQKETYDMTEIKRLCVLSFDEMYVSNSKY